MATVKFSSLRYPGVCSDAVHSFIVGGEPAGDMDGLTVFQYSARCNLWKHVTIDAPGLRNCAAAVANDTLVVIGGIRSDIGGLHSELIRVPVSSWVHGATVASEKSTCGVEAAWGRAACTAEDGLILFHGGYGTMRAETPLGALYIYDVSTDLVKGPFFGPSLANHSMCYARGVVWLTAGTTLYHCGLATIGEAAWVTVTLSGAAQLSSSTARLLVIRNEAMLLHYCWKDQLLSFTSAASSTEIAASSLYPASERAVPPRREPDVVLLRSDGRINLLYNSDIFVLQPRDLSVTLGTLEFARNALQPTPPSPMKLTQGIAAPSPTASRLLMRIVPQDEGLRGCTVKSRRGATASSASVHVDAAHPNESQVSIETSLTRPVTARIVCNYETDSDTTTIRLDYVDVARALSVQVEQNIKIALGRERRLEMHHAEIDAEWNTISLARDDVRRENAALDQRRAELDELRCSLDSLREAQDDEKRVIAALRDEVVEARACLARDRAAFEREVAAREETERENMSRLRTERDALKKTERDMELERKANDKTRENLQRAIDSQQNLERQLQREMERLEREREQHHRAAEWAKEKEELWMQEKAQYERRLATLAADLQQSVKSGEIAAFEAREAKQQVTNLTAEIARLGATVDELQGRRRGESDMEWSKRRDNEARNAEQCSKGRFSTVGFALDTGSGSNLTVFVEGGETRRHLFPGAVVASTDVCAGASFVQLEIGDGFTEGDAIVHTDASPNSNGSRLYRIAIAAGSDVRSAVESAMRGAVFVVASTRPAFFGVRTVEVTIFIEGKKHQSTLCTGQALVAVMEAPLVPFRDAAPFVERAAPVAVFGHMRIANPFAELTAAKSREAATVAYLEHGLGGPHNGAERPDPRTVNAYVTRFAGLTELRRGWKLLPLQVDERGIFGSATLTITMERLQDEDNLSFTPTCEDEVLIADTAVASVTASEAAVTVVVQTKPEATRNQLNAALRSIVFHSAAIPLDESPRCISTHVNLPNFRVPLNYTSSSHVRIVNAAHEVSVVVSTTTIDYRPHSSSVNDMHFAPPTARILSTLAVVDPLQSRFSGKAVLSVAGPGDKLGIIIATPFDKTIGFDSATGIASTDGGATAFATVVVEEQDNGVTMIIAFNRHTRAQLAEALLRSVVFATADTTIGATRGVSLTATLGRGHASSASLNITISPPIVHVAKLGGVKWTEHQGPVMAALQLCASPLAVVSGSPLRVSVLVMVAAGREVGDVLDAALPGEVEASTEGLQLTSCGAQLDAGSVRRVRRATPSSNAASLTLCNLSDGSLFVDMVAAEREHFDAALTELLSRVTFIHNTASPAILKKVLCVRTEDVAGIWSDALLPLSVVPVDDPTEIHDLPKVTLFVQGARCAVDGLPIAATARLHDPDTDDFVGGSIVLEPEGPMHPRDVVKILPMAEQRRWSPMTVFVDERMRIFTFSSPEDFGAYEEALARNIIFGRSDDVTANCVGFVSVAAIEASAQSPLLPEAQQEAPEELTRSKTGGSFVMSAASAVFGASSPTAAFRPERWEVRFSPPVSRLISLEKVQAVLRAFAFQNTAPSATGDRQFVITLGAGTLASYASSADDAKLADQTVQRTTVRVAAPLLFLPGFVAKLLLPAGGGMLQPFKGATVAPLNETVFVLANAKLAVSLASPLDEDGITLILKKAAGDVALETAGNSLVVSATKAVVATIVTTTRTAIELALAPGIDSRALQSIVRSIAFERTEASPTKRAASLSQARAVIVVEVHDCIAPDACAGQFVPQRSFPSLTAEISPAADALPAMLLFAGSGGESASVDHILRSGGTFLFKGIGLAPDFAVPALLRCPTAVSIVMPPAASGLTLLEDFRLRLRSPTDEELTHWRLYSGSGASASHAPSPQSPRKDPNRVPQLQQASILFNGWMVGMLSTSSSGTRGTVSRIDCLAMPPTVLVEVLRRFQYTASPKDKSGSRHVVRIMSQLAHGSGPEIAVTVNIKPPLIDDMPKTAAVVLQGKPVCPFATIKVRPPMDSFARGAASIELGALESGQRVCDADCLRLLPSDRFTFTFTTEESGILLIKSDAGADVPIADITATRTAVRFAFSDAPTLLTADTVTQLCRTCIAVDQCGPDASSTFEPESNYTVTLCVATAANEAECSVSINVSVASPLDKKKSRVKKSS